MKTTILIMVLDEIQCLPIIMPQIDRKWADQILVVDGGSTDGSIEWCKENNWPVYEQKRKGIRFGYIESIPLCIGDVILTMSPDGNCDVSKIPAMIAVAKGGFDLTVGSRYLNSKSDDDDLLTGFGNLCFRELVYYLYGGHLTDPMVIYRAFRKELFYELELHKEETYSLYERLFHTVISIEPIMTVRAIKAKKLIMEIGVGEPARIGGTRKLQIWRWGAAYLTQIIREVWFWKPKN
jgi:glycosyltransferase involved in cell wall biosynthesis